MSQLQRVGAMRFDRVQSARSKLAACSYKGIDSHLRTAAHCQPQKAQWNLWHFQNGRLCSHGSAACVRRALDDRLGTQNPVRARQLRRGNGEASACAQKLETPSSFLTPSASGIQVLKLQRQLHDIDERFEDGRFEDAEHNVPAGQAVLSELLSEAHELVETCYEKFPEEETESP